MEHACWLDGKGLYSNVQAEQQPFAKIMVNDIYNFRAIGDKLGTAGQPTAEQLERRAGSWLMRRSSISRCRPPTTPCRTKASIVIWLGYGLRAYSGEFRRADDAGFSDFFPDSGDVERPSCVCALRRQHAVFPPCVFLHRVLRQNVPFAEAKRGPLLPSGSQMPFGAALSLNNWKALPHSRNDAVFWGARSSRSPFSVSRRKHFTTDDDRPDAVGGTPTAATETVALPFFKGGSRTIPQNVAVVTAGILDQILLVIILGGVKFSRGRDFRRDWPVELAGFHPSVL